MGNKRSGTEGENGLVDWEAIDAMTAADRDALIRQTFDAYVDILFVQSKATYASDLHLTDAMTEHLRRGFREHMEQHWPEWQAELADSPDDRLYFTRDELYDQLNALGLKERQRQNAVDPGTAKRGMHSLDGGGGPEPGPSPEQSRGSRRGR